MAKRGRARNGRRDAWPPFVISSNVSLPRENKIIQGFDSIRLRRNKICRLKNDFYFSFPMGHRLAYSELGGALRSSSRLLPLTSSYQHLYNMQKLSSRTTTSRTRILIQCRFSTNWLVLCASLVFITSTIFAGYASADLCVACGEWETSTAGAEH